MEIMRHGMVILGLFIVFLMLIAGCTSPDGGVTTGSKNRHPADNGNNGKITSVSSPLTSPACYPVDPRRFQQFLPDIAGYKPYFTPDDNMSLGYYHNYDNTEHRYSTQQLYGVPLQDSVDVTFIDYGPCVTESTGVYSEFSGQTLGTDSNNITKSKIDNFHGYPAIKEISLGKGGISDMVSIGVSNRLCVIIIAFKINDNYTISEEDAKLEKFASAIDFRGFAASV